MLFDAPDFDAHEEVAFVADVATGLQAVIAVHSTHLGPAAGGCRWWSYADDAAALTDALRLSRGMSYKNAMAGLPMGGGKAVVLKGAAKTEAFLEAFGRAVEGLGGRYVTAEDVGMSDADMTVIARTTKHVSGLPVAGGAAGGNPGPSTAEGVFVGMRAAVRHKLGRDGFQGVHVAVQGLGSVGGSLARKLSAAGAKLTVADIDDARAAALAAELGATHVANDAVMRTAADVFSPNALGAILNEASIGALDVAVVAGAANNQLAQPRHGDDLHARGILYAPDYAINAGGLVNVAQEVLGYDAQKSRTKTLEIYDTIYEISDRSAKTGTPTYRIADMMVEEKLAAVSRSRIRSATPTPAG